MFGMGKKVKRALRAGHSAAAWLLFLTLLHTVPSPWILPVAGGLAPAVFLLAFGFASLFSTDQGALAMAAMMLVPALVYSGIFLAGGHLLSRLLGHIERAWVRTGLLAGLVGGLLVMSLFPIYASGGHSQSYTHNILDLIALLRDYRLPGLLVVGYPIALLSLLLGLLAWQYAPPRLSLPRLKLFRRLVAAILTVALLAAFIYVHRTLLIVKPLAELGWATAQVKLARALIESSGKEFHSEVSARTWLERAAQQGHLEAAVELARLARSAEDREKWLRISAEQGDSEGQYELYRLLLRGKGAPERRAEALAWLNRAAANGHGRAQFELGGFYIRGTELFGVAQDPAAARTWWERAADQGQGKAMQELAWRFAQGVEGFPRNPAKAIAFWRQMAEGLGKGLYGFDRNEAQAAAWLQRAEELAELLCKADAGEADALATLGWQILKSQNPGPGGKERGLALLEQAAEKGDAELQYDLGAMFIFGNHDLAKDFERGHRWWALAAKQGHLRTMEYLVSGYQNGNYGYSVDLLEARALVERLLVAAEKAPDEAKQQRWQAELAHLQRLFKLAGGSYLPLAGLRAKAEAGDAAAQYQLARQLLVSGAAVDRDEGLRWLNRAADGGDAEAQYRLVIYFENQAHIMRDDPARGVRLLSEAAMQSHPQAMSTLALAYEKGRYGLKRDLYKARELYQAILDAHQKGRFEQELDGRFLGFQKSRIEVVTKLIKSIEERQQRYEQGTELERSIMQIEDRYR